MSRDDFYKEPTNPTTPTDPHLINPSEIPKKIGPYKIESLFEKGGMSVLYIGENINTHEPAIIKVLSKKYLLNKEVTNRFLKEADIISMTDHPNIVKIYGHGEWEGGLYMAIEFVQGISLRQYISQNYVSLKHALEMIIEMAYALCHLHMHGVIHRDLKPDNILVTESGETKMIDFGVAQLLTEKTPIDFPLKPHLIGTPVYMSPEQKQDSESVSYPSDIYSLAIIAYELILGKLSYGQIHLGLMPKGLRKIFIKALQQDVKTRYQDVVDFIADLSAFLNSEDIKEEQNAKDQLSDLSDYLRKTRLIFVPKKVPPWKSFDLGIATNNDSFLLDFQQILYQDFFEINEEHTYGILMSESSLKNKETVIHTAATRGMIRAIFKLAQEPKELVAALNDLIINDPLRYSLSLSYATISLKDNQLKYIACGDGQLAFLVKKTKTLEKIENQNPFVGADSHSIFKEVCYPFDPEEMLCLVSFAGTLLKDGQPLEILEQELMKSLMENLDLPAERLSQNILKRLKMTFSKTIYNSIVCAIIVKRT